MPQVLPGRLVGVAVSWALLIGAAQAVGPSAGGGRSSEPMPTPGQAADYRAWCDLLGKALAHSANDKAYIDSVSSRTPSAKIGLLARVLLEEWDMTPGDTRLSTPRAVYAPTPGPSGIEKFYKGRSPLAIVEGVVGSDGFVRDLRVLRPSGYPALNDTCLARLRATRFRPARVGNAYVPTKLGLLCNPDVQ